MAVCASLEYLNITEACIRCEIDSAIPETGMGSSWPSAGWGGHRAVSTTIRLICLKEVLEIWSTSRKRRSYELSGLDAKTRPSDQPIRFIKNVGFTELEMDLFSHLVIADTVLWSYS